MSTSNRPATGGSTDPATPADSWSGLIDDLEGIQCRLDNLYRAARILGLAHDVPDGGGEPSVFYAAADILELLHRDVTQLITRGYDLRRAGRSGRATT